MRAHGYVPNVITFSAAISACEKGGQWERALSLLTEMRAQGVEPNVISFNAAISACDKGAQWEHALELLKEMQARGLQPGEIAFSAAISACAQREEWNKAHDLYAAAVSLKALPQMDENGKFDLHELNGPVARVAVAWTLERLARGELPLLDSGLKIVTGQGKHSHLSNTAGGAVIKPQVEAMLASATYAGLGAHEDGSNTGRLVVSAASLRAWIAARRS